METLLSIKELLQKSFNTYKDLLLELIWISAVNLFSYALFLPITLSALFIFSKKPSPNMPSFLVIVFFAIIWVVINFFIVSWTTSSTMYALKEKEKKHKVSQLLKMGWATLPSYLWISILAGVLIICGFVLLIIPGIILVTWYAFSLYAFVFEGIKGVEALQRSSSLVSGYFWPILGRMAVLMALCIAVPMIFNNFFTNIITLFVVTPFSVMYIYFLYEDVKRVKGDQVIEAKA